MLSNNPIIVPKPSISISNTMSVSSLKNELLFKKLKLESIFKIHIPIDLILKSLFSNSLFALVFANRLSYQYFSYLFLIK